MTHKILLALIALALLAALASCRAPEPTPAAEAALQITLAVEPEPARVGAAALLITVTGADGQPVNDARINARGDMTHAGMVPVLGEAEGGADGLYRIPFEWTMGGDWFVDVTVTLPDGTTAAQRFDLSVEP